MQTKRGIPVSPGICIGEAMVIGQEELRIRRRSIPQKALDEELRRLDKAIALAVEEGNQEIERLGGDSHLTRQILESHRDILADTSLHSEIAGRIRTELSSAEHAVVHVLRAYRRRFERMQSEYISERAHDLVDIEKKLLRALLGKSSPRELSPAFEAVIVGHNLTPGETAALDTSVVHGFAIDVGGRTSHTAIMARAMQIPAVVGLEDVSQCVSGGERIIVDGYSGVVVIDPDPKTLEDYVRREALSRAFRRRLHEEVCLPAETLDGYEISIAANIEMPHEIHNALEWGARGIGLYRTEFLYDQGVPDEERHYRTYCGALEDLQGKYLVLRTLDAGADKFHREAVGSPEKNPFLGCRGIRLCFQRPELLRSQLRAALRASRVGPIRIMLPMISGLDELRRSRGILEEVQGELEREGIAFDHGIPLGIMVEVPSTALLADLFAREVSFFSIGTNDLIQYSLAVDRVNERVAHLYQPAHPAILRLVANVIEAGHRQGIEVSICGEMCGEPIYAILLLGLGLRSFSVSPISIPVVKRLVRSVTMKDAVEVARHCLRFETAEESHRFLEARVRELLPDSL